MARRLCHRLMSTMRRESPMKLYSELVRRGDLKEDPSQLKALKVIENLHVELSSYEPPSISSDSKSGNGGLFSSIFGGGMKNIMSRPQNSPQGIYLWGGVGCGKTMLMDMFYKCVETPKKRRVHFHAFMLDLHKRMHELRTNDIKGDPIPQISKEIIEEGWLLCFDEFQVTDVADAVVMRRLFDELWSHGLVVFATSNRPPDDLYFNGIQRELFVPFIDECKERCTVHHLLSPTDYRLMGTQTAVYKTPLNDETSKFTSELFDNLTKSDPKTSPKTLQLRGRTLQVPLGSHKNGVAKFTFHELCAMPKGAEDFISISEAFHTVFVVDVPTLTRNEVNQVRRFITLVDTLYERKVRAIFTAMAVPRELLVSDGGPEDELFAFDRTISRLTEMQSLEYLSCSGKRCNGAPLDLFEEIIENKAVAAGTIDDIYYIYDADLNGELTNKEMRFLLEDLSLGFHGNSYVTDKQVEEGFDVVRNDIEDYATVSSFQEGFSDLVELVRGSSKQ